MSKFTSECRDSIRKAITGHFDLHDLETLCFALNVTFENLDRGTLDRLARSIITYFEHRNDAETLVRYLKEQRPNVYWCEDFVDEVTEIRREFDEIASKSKEAVKSIGRLNKIMAESRLLELEITATMFGNLLSPDQRKRMQKHINELRNIIDTES